MDRGADVEKSWINKSVKVGQKLAERAAIIVHELHFAAHFTGQCSISSMRVGPWN